MASLVQILEQSLHDLYTTRYNQVAPVTLYLYNYLLTFPDEVDLFWNRQLSIAQVLFYAIRYLSVGWEIFIVIAYMNIHDSEPVIVRADTFVKESLSNALPVAPFTIFYFQSCREWGHHIYGAQGISVISVLHAILILRLYGLYGSRKLAYVLSLLLAATITGEVYIIAKYSPTFVETAIGKELGDVCLPSYSHKLTLIWPLALSFEVIIALLAVYKGAEQWANGNLRRSRLMQVILRDSLTYFFIIVALDIVNLVLWLHARTTLVDVTFTFSGTVMTILGTQMLINIRTEGRNSSMTTNTDNTVDLPTTVGTALEFRRATVGADSSISREG